MRKTEVAQEVDPADYDRTENYFPKRFGAYIIDSLLVLFVLLVPFFLFGADMTDPTVLWLFVFCLGMATLIFKSAFEYFKKETPGKNLLGLNIVVLAEDVPVEAFFIRNVSMVLPLVVPALDMAYGYFTSVDNRQRLLDKMNKMLVVEVMPVLVREIVRRPVRIEPRPEPERFRLGFDEGYARGTCPRCGAPYRVLPPGNTGFSGLWNHRCTWCNSLIQEGLV